MNYIKSLHVEGFKKFQTLNVEFNEHMNILVGENEAGKSTILDAIKTVLNQQYRLADKSVLRDLFNAQMVEAFEANPSVKTLPRILIEVELVLDPKTLITSMEKCMEHKKSKMKNLESDSSVSTMNCWEPVWSNLYWIRKSRTSITLLHG